MSTYIYNIQANKTKQKLYIAQKNHFKPQLKASNKNTFNNHHRITQGNAFSGCFFVCLFACLFFFSFLFLFLFQINALRLDMTFLEISTNIPKQFSRLCGIRLSGLVSILKNKSARPTPPTQPTLKHVIVLHVRSNTAT